MNIISKVAILASCESKATCIPKPIINIILYRFDLVKAYIYMKYIIRYSLPMQYTCQGDENTSV